jgi:hypothetical protein
MVDYGNVGWQVYVVAAYVVSGATLLIYGWLAGRQRRLDAAALEAEGFLTTGATDDQGVQEKT